MIKNEDIGNLGADAQLQMMIRKINYWYRVGQCGCHKTDYKPNIKDRRKFLDGLRRECNIMIKLFKAEKK